MRMRKGLLLMVLSPSGGGKGSILKGVFAENVNLRFSISATTRTPRPGEEHGKHYSFVSREEFEVMIKNNELIEYTEYCGNYYGTPKKAVDNWLNTGYDVVLEVEVNGGLQIKKLMPHCISIFILPPSLAVLEKRLRRRGTETDEVIVKRLQKARDEIPHARHHDYIVINDELETAIKDVNAIIRAEKLKTCNNQEIIERMMSNAETIS